METYRSRGPIGKFPCEPGTRVTFDGYEVRVDGYGSLPAFRGRNKPMGSAGPLFCYGDDDCSETVDLDDLLVPDPVDLVGRSGLRVEVRISEVDAAWSRYGVDHLVLSSGDLAFTFTVQAGIMKEAKTRTYEGLIRSVEWREQERDVTVLVGDDTVVLSYPELVELVERSGPSITS